MISEIISVLKLKFITKHQAHDKLHMNRKHEALRVTDHNPHVPCSRFNIYDLCFAYVCSVTSRRVLEKGSGREEERERESSRE